MPPPAASVAPLLPSALPRNSSTPSPSSSSRTLSPFESSTIRSPSLSPSPFSPLSPSYYSSSPSLASDAETPKTDKGSVTDVDTFVREWAAKVVVPDHNELTDPFHVGPETLIAYSPTLRRVIRSLRRDLETGEIRREDITRHTIRAYMKRFALRPDTEDESNKDFGEKGRVLSTPTWAGLVRPFSSLLRAVGVSRTEGAELAPPLPLPQYEPGALYRFVRDPPGSIKIPGVGILCEVEVADASMPVVNPSLELMDIEISRLDDTLVEFLKALVFS